MSVGNFSLNPPANIEQPNTQHKKDILVPRESSGTFPDGWKKARDQRIVKKSRQISRVWTISNVAEKIIITEILRYRE